MDAEKLVLSNLPKTWIIDYDGTIVEHNSHLYYGEDRLLERSKEFLESIPDDDFVIIVTARTEEHRRMTEDFLRRNSIRYNELIFGLPPGERILINDIKPSGLRTAYSINVKRDEGIELYTENRL